MQRILDGFYLLEASRHVNSYLIEDSEGLTIIDAGPPDGAEAIVEELRHGGFRIEDVHKLILTHAHADHIGGAAGLLRRHRVKVFAHPADIPAIQGREALPPRPGRWRRWKNLVDRFWRRIEPLDVLVPLAPGHSLRPLATWQILHTAGHTPGSLSLFDPVRRLLVCGDALTNRRGRLAVEVAPNSDGIAAQTLSQLASLQCEVLATGHGPVIRESGAQRILNLAAGYRFP